MSNELLEESTSSMLAKVSQDQMVTWSDQVKKDFAETFEKRAKVAQYLLLETAEIIINAAKEKHFIGGPHAQQIKPGLNQTGLYDKRDGCGYSYTVGGRTLEELNVIAQERAELILDELPSLNAAVRIIDVSTSKKIERRDQLLKELKALKLKLEEEAGPINMADYDQTMTIGEFRKMVKDRNKRRTALFDQMTELGEEGHQLDEAINKALYKGLPGLSDAVIKVAQTHIDRAMALSGLNRRVGEKVMFGDSDAAMDLLKGFETDEVALPQDVKKEFQAAMDKLRLSKKKKQLKK